MTDPSAARPPAGPRPVKAPTGTVLHCKNRGEPKAPIVMGRDHLHAGSAASPNRETEAMIDNRASSRAGRARESQPRADMTT